MADNNFDPDAYLAKHEKEEEFNPDSYLEKYAAPEEPSFLDKAKDVGLSALEKTANVLGYPGRVLRGGLVTAMKPGVDIGDFADVALSPINPSKKSKTISSGQAALNAIGVKRTPFDQHTFVDVPFTDQKLDVTNFIEDLTDAAVELGTDVYAPKIFKETGKETLKLGGKALKYGGKAIQGTGNLALKAGENVLAPIAEGAVGKGGEAAVRGYAEGLKDSIKGVFNRKPVPLKNAPQMLETAKELGLADDEIKALSQHPNLIYGKDSDLANNWKFIAEGPGGESERLAHNALKDSVRSGFSNKIAKISNGGSLFGEAQAGEALKGALDTKVKDILKSVDFTYQSAASQMPQGGRFGFSPEAVKTLNRKLLLMKVEANRMLNNPVSSAIREQGQNNINAINAVLDGLKSKKTYSQMIEGMQDIGRVAFKGEPTVLGKVPSDKKFLRDMYFNISDAAKKTTLDFVGKDAAKSLEENNKILHDMFKKTKGMGDIVNKIEVSPEKAFSDVIKSGDTNKLKNFIDFFGADSDIVKQMKGSWLESIKDVNKEGEFLFGTMRKRLVNDDKASRIFKMLFSPEEQKIINNSLELGDSIGDTVLNTSKTNVSARYGDVLKEVRSGANARASDQYMRARAEGMPENYIPGSMLPQITGGGKTSISAVKPPPVSSAAMGQPHSPNVLLSGDKLKGPMLRSTSRQIIEQTDLLRRHEESKKKLIPQKQAAEMWQNSN